MCYGCWQECGEPTIDTSAVRAAARAIGVVYSHDCVGGNLHNVIEDWNLEDGNLDFCAGSIAENFFEATPAQLAAERHCLGLLRALTEDERASALAMHGGYVAAGA
jgi:hypothetical protein